MKITSLVIVTALVVLSSSSANALKCWRCSSDAPKAAFCEDPFDSGNITEENLKWAYVDCVLPPMARYPTQNESQSSQPVCKKTIQLINDKVVTSRSCTWGKVDEPADSCMQTPTPSYIKTKFCETCTSDGCNGALDYRAIETIQKVIHSGATNFAVSSLLTLASFLIPSLGLLQQH